MELGKEVEALRLRKNLTVKKLCDGIITKSTYSRFVNGHVMIKADSLLEIVSRLNMTFAMFLQDYVDFFKLKHDYTLLYHAIVFNELDLMADLINDYSSVSEDSKNEMIFLQTAKIMKLYSQRELEEPDVLHAGKAYFEGLDYWTDYDYKTFKHLSALYETDFVIKIVHSIINLITDLSSPTLQEEVFYILGITFARLLTEHQFDQASSIYAAFNQLYVDQNDLGKGIYHVSIKALFEIVYHQKLDYVQEYEDMIEFYDYLKMDSRVDELIELYGSIQSVLELPNLSFEKGGKRVGN